MCVGLIGIAAGKAKGKGGYKGKGKGKRTSNVQLWQDSQHRSTMLQP